MAHGHITPLAAFAAVAGLVLLAGAQNEGRPRAGAAPPRDVTFFLRRLRTLDHLPELEAAHTAMASTWDAAGGNRDGDGFKAFEYEWEDPRIVRIEGEDLPVLKASGTVGPFPMKSFGEGWSGAAILWWREIRPGARLEVAFPAPAAGPRRVLARFSKAPDYGIHRVSIDGRSAGRFDLYDPRVVPGELVDLGVFDLRQSGNRLAVEVMGANPRATPGTMFGLDDLVLAEPDAQVSAADPIPPPKAVRNVLLDVDGPGCVHRLFCGWLGDKSRTRIQVFLDHASAPLFDLPVEEFFDYQNGPFPYPLVFHKSYPGLLFPIPYARHCRIQLVNPTFGTPAWDRGSWSNYWQVTHTSYPEGTPVQSLAWPLDEGARLELERTCQAWLRAESTAHAAPERWSVESSWTLAPGASQQVELEGAGVIRQLRVTVEPHSAELLRGLRLRMSWNGADFDSVDAPVGHLFGHAYCEGGRMASSRAAALGRGFAPSSRGEGSGEYSTDFHSLPLSVTGTSASMRFPMPFARGARIRLANESAVPARRVELRVEVEARQSLPAEWGFFHATWSEERAATEAVPGFGPQAVPCHAVLDRRARGKYVGVILYLDWPHPRLWWGEGDWLIWTDEAGWPPSYHGTGSEEYFNSGWCLFDRKAISGFATLRPGHPTLYSFHLNDAFQFQHRVRVLEEQMGCQREAVRAIETQHPAWGSTAFWYASIPMPAESRQGKAGESRSG